MARHFFGNPRVLAVGAQTDISTANPLSGDHHVFAAEYDLPEPDHAQTTWQGGVRRAGAKTAPVPGKRGATFKIKFPLRVTPSSYDPNVDEFDTGKNADPGMLLLGTALGSKGSVTAANWLFQEHMAQVKVVSSAVLAGSTSTSIVLDGAAPDAPTDAGLIAGGFIACASDENDVSPQFGWVKTVAGAGASRPVTLYEASKNTAAGGDLLIASCIAFLSSNQPNPLTFRGYTGLANSDFLLVGCYCTDGEITVAAGDVWWCALTFWCADYQTVSGTTALPANTGSWRIMPPPTDGNNGRFTYGPSGTGSPNNVEGWKDLKVSWSTPIEKVQSLAGINGYGTPGVATPNVKVNASIAFSTSDAVTDGETALVTDWRNGAAFSICASTGKLPGQIASVFLPSLIHTKAPVPKASGEGGMVYYDIEAEPADGYVSDGSGFGATEPANSLLRFVIA